MDILVYIAPLTYILLLQIALERSTTARQAIQMMGDLATELGFYAADWVGGDASKGKREQDFVICTCSVFVIVLVCGACFPCVWLTEVSLTNCR